MGGRRPRARCSSIASIAVLACLATACGNQGSITGGPLQAANIVTSAGSGAGTGLPCATPGQLDCGGGCIDIKLDPRNCGACNRSCGTGACIDGACVCPGNLTVCASGCADTTSDPANCGACGTACAAGLTCQLGRCAPPPLCTPSCVGGQQCIAGSCQCAVGQAFCGGVCLDPNTTPQHCGVCGHACEPGKLCEAGQCVCTPGQTICGTSCVDLQTSKLDCGVCGNACSGDEVCMAGKCRAPLGADGCGGAARDISLSEVSAYQAIKIPLAKGVTAIASKDRVAAVIEGRDALFRISVAPATGFAPRELSARVIVKNGTTPEQFFARQRVTKASTDADTASTFQVNVPAAKVLADTTYAVELVECSEVATGIIAQPRFPAMGDVPLAPRKTGVLKINLVPLSVSSRVPDTTEPVLAKYRAYLEAMYPIERAVFTVGKPVTVSSPVNWSNTLDQLRMLRQSERPAADVYYFGLLKPTDTFQQYCRTGCTAGIGYVGSATQAATHVAMGLAFADETSAGVMAHEVGHNHGRNHAPCAPGNQISGVDSRYPHKGALTSVWGYDNRKQTFFNPDKTTDIMGYCEPQWISDYTYKALIERVATINGVTFTVFGDAELQTYQVMLVDATGPRWSQPFNRPDEPFGEPELAEVLDKAGQTIESVTVYRTWIGDHDGSTVLVPPAKQGWHSVRTSDGSVLAFDTPVSVPAPFFP